MSRSEIPPLMPSATAVLRACGWLAQDAELAKLEDLSSSHSVRRATRGDGAAVIVKHRRDSEARAIAGELFIYRLAGWSVELRAIFARPLHIDDAAGILVLEALPGVNGHGGRVTAPGFMRRIGEALATVHRATLRHIIPASPAAGIFAVADQPHATGFGRPPQTQALMLRIARDRLLADALRRAKDDYACCCLIHGDLRPDHWAEMPDRSLRLLDWEMGGAGDPRFDLAAALIEPALDSIRRGTPETCWLARAEPAIAALTAGYRARGGDALLDADGAWAHVLRLGAARLLHIACEWCDTGRLAASVDALVEAARSLVRGLEPAAARLAA